MRLNISDEETVEEPTDADIERAIRTLVVEPMVDPGEAFPDPSFAVLLKGDSHGDWLSAERIPATNYSGRRANFTVALRDSGTGRAYRCWVPAATTVVALFQAFRDGASPLPLCFEHGFIWCDRTEWAGHLAHTPPGWNEEAEERLEEESCITFADVVDVVLDMRHNNPGLAALR